MDRVDTAQERKIELHGIPRGVIDFVLKVAYRDVAIQTLAFQFINQILEHFDSDAIFEDSFVTNFTACMYERLKEVASPIRVEAIKALQRFQHPENLADKTIERFLYHLRNDQCPKVRLAVLDSIVRCDRTVSTIISCRTDIDDKVRSHCYVALSKISMLSYSVQERITILEDGLYHPSEPVQRVVRGELLVRWLQCCNGDYITFIRLLKLGESDEEIEQSCKIVTEVLRELFKGKGYRNQCLLETNRKSYIFLII